MDSQYQNQVAGTWPKPSIGAFNYDVLVVAGGGAGAEGGGGGGGYRILSCQPATPGTYTVTIGAGGVAASPGNTVKGTDGGDSLWNVGPANITSTGGGAGGSSGPSPQKTGNPGGSGGGGGIGTGSAGSGNTPAVPAPLGGPQGNDGAPGTPGPGWNNSGGGGGAAAGGSIAVGGAGQSAIPVFGAAPQPYYPVTGPGEGYFAGGGGGRAENPNPAPTTVFAGGIGGGGMGSNGGNTPCGGTPAPSKTGVVNSGGGGGMYYPGDLGNGGSGVVLIKIPSAAYPYVSICGSNSLVPTPSGGVAHFVASGTLTVD